jgi:hypothetical protein
MDPFDSEALQGREPTGFFKEPPLIDSVASACRVVVDKEEDFSVDSELEFLVNGVAWVFSSFLLHKDRNILA